MEFLANISHPLLAYTPHTLWTLSSFLYSPPFIFRLFNPTGFLYIFCHSYFSTFWSTLLRLDSVSLLFIIIISSSFWFSSSILNILDFLTYFLYNVVFFPAYLSITDLSCFIYLFTSRPPLSLWPPLYSSHSLLLSFRGTTWRLCLLVVAQ